MRRPSLRTCSENQLTFPLAGGSDAVAAGEGSHDKLRDRFGDPRPSPKARPSPSTLPKEGEVRCVDTNAQREGNEYGSLSILLALSISLLFSLLSTSAGGPASAGEQKKKDLQPIRELYVPFDVLNVLLEGKETRHVFLSRKQYEDLLAKAKQSPPEDVPLAAAPLAADYVGELEEGRARLAGRLVIDVLEDGIHAVPLDLAGVGVAAARLDGQPAALGRDEAGKILLFVEGKGRHELDLTMTTPLETTAAQQSLRFRLPTPPATRLQLSAPGNVDVKSGAAVIAREVTEDGSLTRLELKPERREMAIVMSLNNRLLQRERVVVAQSVVVSEITTAFERLHSKTTLRILHGAADGFQFALPDGFEVTKVSSPLLSEWEVNADDAGTQLLDVRLRETTSDITVINIVATRARKGSGPWSMPQVTPQDVSSHVAIVGMLVENRIRAEKIAPEDMVPLNSNELPSVYPESVVEVETERVVAAFYAPQSVYRLSAELSEPPAKLRATTNLVLDLDETRQHVRGSFALVSEAEKLFAVDVMAPPGWLITEAREGIARPDKSNSLKLEQYDLGDAGSRVHIRLSRGYAPGEPVGVFFEAEGSPEGWLGQWQLASVAFPAFAVKGATHDKGAIAVAAIDDFVIRPSDLAGLVPLDEDGKAGYNLANVPSQLAYRYEAQPYSATFAVERKRPWITARTYSFFRIGADTLSAHYELIYDIQNARTDQLTLLLPAGTPSALSIEGMEGTNLKEYHGNIDQDDRLWTVRLAEPARGKVTVSVDFEQPLSADGGQSQKLPLVRADDVAYQSGIVAVEGDTELEIQVETDARKVDVGELVDAEYEIGREGQRVLGVYGFVGDPPEVTVGVTRHEIHDLPTTIVQSATLFTQVAPGGNSLTQADYALRTKALFLEIELPKGAKLWSAVLDGKPSKPQTDKGRQLLSLGAGATSVRQLQVVYEAPISEVGFVGTVDLPAPQLSVRAESEAQSQPVPVTHVTWTLRLPAGYRVVRTDGTVFTDELPERPSPVAKAGGALFVAMGGLFAPMQAMREASRRARVASNQSQLGMAYDQSESMATTDEASAGGYFEYAEGEAESDGGMDYSEDATGDDEATSEDEPPADTPADALDDLFGAAEMPPVNGPALPDPHALPPQPVVPESDRAAPPLQPPVAGKPAAPTTPGLRDSGLGETLGLQQQLEDAQDLFDYDLDQDEVDVEKLAATLKTRIQPGGVKSIKKTSLRFDKLLGIASLNIQLDQGGEAAAGSQEITFESLGAEPRLVATLVNQQRMSLLAWGIALTLALIGVLLTGRPARTKATYVIFIAAVAALLPQVSGRGQELGDVCDLAFFAACLLVPYYLVAALMKSIFTTVTRRFGRAGTSSATTAALVAIFFVTATAMSPEAMAASPAKPQSSDGRYIVQVVGPPAPVTIPADAIIVPYDPEKKDEDTDDDDQKLLVPYEKYVELWNRAYPDAKLEATPPPAEYALAGAAYRAELSGDEFLTVHGQIDVDLFTDQPVTIPLPLAGGVLARALVDGQPARLKATAAEQAPPAQAKNASRKPADASAMILLYAQGKGRKRLDVTIRLRLTRDGGLRIATGQLPHAPATALNLTVPAAQTEVRLGGVVDRSSYETEVENQRIETAIAYGQPLSIQWQPKVGEGEVDRSLTVISDAVLDLREDGVRLVWQLGLEFPRSQRESFTIAVPEGYLVERVTGDNVRGWERREDAAGTRIEVTLLKAVGGGETIVVQLARHQSLIGEWAVDVAVPRVDVVGAALHSGRLTIRRSPLLEIRADRLSGLTRTDVPAADVVAALVSTDTAAENPLQNIRTYQAYQFVAMPFEMELAAGPVPTKRRAEIRSLVEIADLETGLDTRVIIHPAGSPVFGAKVIIPENLSINHVGAPEPFEWSVVEEGGERILELYLGSGQSQPFSIYMKGKLESGDNPALVAVPRLEVLDVDRQEGDVVFRADPAFDLRAEDLVGCQRVLLVQVSSWVKAEQQRDVRTALRFTSPGYGGAVRLVPRTPRVSCVAVTNVLVSDEKIEETILLEYTIEQAGMKEIVFQLPKRLERARIGVEGLRQQAIEPVPAARGEAAVDDDESLIRVTLDLQDERMGQLMVMVQNDRLATGRRHTAPLPIVENVENVQRYVTLEYAGMNDPVVDDAAGVQQLSRHQQQFRRVAEIFEGDLLEAYSVAGNDDQTPFRYSIKVRETVETAGAHIGLAETQLAIDAAGAFHGRMVLKVDNETEQYLQILLPENSQLWTSEVAGLPVKPTVVPGGKNPREIRIPLRKTQPGDADYVVVLQYGGRLLMPGTLRSLRMPLIRTQNISVDRSHVQLYLPRDRQWLSFAGSMERAVGGDKEAGHASYLGKKSEELVQALRSKNLFVRSRAIANLPGLKAANDALMSSADRYATNEDLQKNIYGNAGKIQEIEQLVQNEEEFLEAGVELDNRGRLSERWRKQKTTRARNVVQDVGSNWSMEEQRQPVAPASEQRLNPKWVKGNKLWNRKQDVPAEQAGKQNLPSSALSDRSSLEESRGRGEGQGHGRGQGETPAAGRQSRGFQNATGQMLAQPPAAGVQRDLRTGFAGQESTVLGRSARGNDAVVRKDDVRERARRYQQKYQQQAGQVAGWHGDVNGIQVESESRSGREFTVEGRHSDLAPSFSADGQVIASASDDGTITMWDTGGGRAVAAGEIVTGGTALTLADGDAALPAGYASLHVDLVFTGEEFVFKSPRQGDILARSAPRSGISRLWRAGQFLIALLVVLAVYRLARYVGVERLTGRTAATILLVVGVLSLFSCMLPIAGLIMLLTGIALFIYRANRPRRTAGA